MISQTITETLLTESGTLQLFRCSNGHLVLEKDMVFNPPGVGVGCFSECRICLEKAARLQPEKPVSQ